MLRRLGIPFLVIVSVLCIAAVATLTVLSLSGAVGVHWPAVVAIVSFGWVAETVRELRRRRPRAER